MKQGRNEPCKCGSKQKYKKCCEKRNQENILNIPSNKIIKKQLIEIQKLTECPSDNVLLENFNNSTELKFVSSVEKLPYEIKEQVIKFSKIIKPKNGECETYSSFISLNIPEVKQVRGFFQIPYTKKHGEEFIKDKYNVNKIEYNKVYSDGIYKDILDIHGQVWGTHSWNEYNGIHFDCLKEFLNWNLDVEWFDYRISKSHLLNKIVSKGVIEKYLNPELKKYFQSL